MLRLYRFRVATIQKFRIPVVTLFVSTLLLGCQTTEKALQHQRDESSLSHLPPGTPWSHYTVEMGESLAGDYLLPDFYPIYVNWFSGEHKLSHNLHFKGWDFNRDKRIDLLVVLDENGIILQKAYDFNFDGEIDKIVNLK